jgi:membrane-associated HD superfamily phosphohydrolase
MKNSIILLIFSAIIYNTAFAQDNTEIHQTKVISDKEALKVVTPTPKAPGELPQIEKEESAQPTTAKQARPVIEMTEEYIDNQIAEIQKVIDKNKGNADFNLSGYQKRILYLESRRPSK